MTRYLAALLGDLPRSRPLRVSLRSLTIALGVLTGAAVMVAARRAGRALPRGDRRERLPQDLLAILAHELRTPLNSIVCWTHVLQSGKADAEVTATALRSIASSAQIQRRLIEDIVDTTRAEQHGMPLRTEALDLRSPVRTAVDIVRPAAERTNLALSVAVPSTDCRVWGDPERLEQAFVNVLTNAVKFTRDGGVHVALVRREHEYQVHVVDTGRGITQDFLPLVFRRFQQADRRGRRHDGLGLGLAICRDLLTQHHGWISVESPGPDQGTTVVIGLPALTEEDRHVEGH